MIALLVCRHHQWKTAQERRRELAMARNVAIMTGDSPNACWRAVISYLAHWLSTM